MPATSSVISITRATIRLAILVVIFRVVIFILVYLSIYFLLLFFVFEFLIFCCSLYRTRQRLVANEIIATKKMMYAAITRLGRDAMDLSMVD